MSAAMELIRAVKANCAPMRFYGDVLSLRHLPPQKQFCDSAATWSLHLAPPIELRLGQTGIMG
jgi:hypothetical protein